MGTPPLGPEVQARTSQPDLLRPSGSLGRARDPRNTPSLSGSQAASPHAQHTCPFLGCPHPSLLPGAAWVRLVHSEEEGQRDGLGCVENPTPRPWTAPCAGQDPESRLRPEVKAHSAPPGPFPPTPPAPLLSQPALLGGGQGHLAFSLGSHKDPGGKRVVLKLPLDHPPLLGALSLPPRLAGAGHLS